MGRLEQKKFEELERKRILAEMQELKALEAKEEARRQAKDLERRKAAEEVRRKEIAELEERKRLKAIEDEKKRLWELEREKERAEIEKERLKRIEDDRRIAEEIIARRQAEEEESARLKKDADEARLLKVEMDKKALLENKKKSIIQTFQKSDTKEVPVAVERPRKKIIANPFAQKFEELAKKDEKVTDVLERKKSFEEI